MSIIVARDGIMASDGLTVTGWSIATNRTQKVFQLVDGSLCGGVGQSSVLVQCRMALISGGPFPLAAMGNKDCETVLIRLMPNGRILSYDAGGMAEYPRSMKYHALGAGAEAALGAMDMGASARAACAIAIRRNMGTRGPVRWLEVRKGKR